MARRFVWGVVLAVLVGCEPPVDPEAWRTVPCNCKVDYDEKSRITASYCLVSE